MPMVMYTFTWAIYWVLPRTSPLMTTVLLSSSVVMLFGFVVSGDNVSKRNIALVKDSPDNWADYDVVFIGYPIWWGIAHIVVKNQSNLAPSGIVRGSKAVSIFGRDDAVGSGPVHSGFGIIGNAGFVGVHQRLQ